MRYIDEPTVASVLRMQDLIPAMRQAMIDFSQGRIEQPTRRILEVEAHGAYFASMPAVAARSLGAKLMTFYPGNAQKNLPTHMGLIALFRPETGEPMAIMDGRLITEMRTAAVTAVYVDAVAARDVTSLAILGAGTQGKIHAEALSQIREFEQIRVWNRSPQRAEQLAAAVGGQAMTCEDAVRGADVVVVATSATEPVLQGKWLRRGAKVASVGWGGADGGELDAATMAHTVIVDSREGALTESGNIRRFDAEICAELGEVLDATRPVDSDATVVFDSIGMACQDIAAASLVYGKLAARQPSA